MIDKTSQTPRYYQLKEILKTEIEEKYRPGELFPSQRELMRRSGLAYATIGRTINELVQEGLLYREQGRGTFVAKPERGKDKALKNIAVSFLEIFTSSHLYLSLVLRGIGEVCNREGYAVQLLATPEDTIHKDHLHFARALVEGHQAGLIGASQMSLKDILLIKEAKIPFVSLTDDLPGKDFHCVLSDFFSGACQVLEHLIKLGHRRIGLITGPRHGRGAPFILSGYKASLRRYDLKFDSDLVKEGDYQEETGYRIMKELLSSSGVKISGLFVADDLMAVGAARAAADKGFNVPGDIDIIGGGHSLPLFPLPLLGSIDTRAQEIGRRGAQMLLKLIQGEEIEEPKVIIEPRLVLNKLEVRSQESKY